MTERKGAVTRAEFERLEAELAEMKAMVSAMHSALMVAQPGNEKALVDRVAAVAIAFEVGDQAARWIVRGAQVLAALGVIAGAIWAIRHGDGGPAR